MLGGADNPNGELLSYIIGADSSDTAAGIRGSGSVFSLHSAPGNGIRPGITTLWIWLRTWCGGALAREQRSHCTGERRAGVNVSFT